MKGFVVIGRAGEYTEVSEWLVRGFVGPDAEGRAHRFSDVLNTCTAARNKAERRLLDSRWEEGETEEVEFIWDKPLEGDEANHQHYQHYGETLEYSVKPLEIDT